jgi:aspartyl-tRNA(Asn)/glutamyl-tRNA(Gln) amidotransferase subunit A
MTRCLTTEDLVYLSATEAQHLFATRELSPVELMRAVIERTEKVEPTVNAFTERLFDEAMEQAAHAERRYLGKGGLTPRPLEGLLIAAEEKHAIVGRSLTEGSLVNEGNIATENAPIIDRIAAAGGIIHARTTTPEFSIATYIHSRMWGRDPQSLEPGLQPRRILRWFRRVSGRVHLVPGHRIRYRWLDATTGGGHRDGRLQSSLRTRARCRGAGQRPLSR